MSTEKKRYRRNEAAKIDLKQRTFSATGEVQLRARMTFKSFTIDLSKTVSCPFCLEEDKIQRFLVSGKHDVSQSRAECPFCHNGMLIRTLLKEWNAESYAEWVFNYSRSGFWQKINFAAWRAKLEVKGWAVAFWARYKELKAEVALGYSENTEMEE